MPSVESVDHSDGLKLTFSIQDYQQAKDAHPVTEALAGQPCTVKKRHFVMIKSSTRTANSGTTAKPTEVKTTVDEQSCVAAQLPWREKLWSEVRKTALRQPNAGYTVAQLTADIQAVPGFILRSVSDQTTTDGTEGADGSGKSFHHHFVVQTVAIREVTASPQLFMLPEGYKLFSEDQLLLASAAAPSSQRAAPDSSKSSTKPSQPPKGKDSKADTPLGEAVGKLGAIFFCALSGTYACGLVP
jgi:hypothetical protein